MDVGQSIDLLRETLLLTLVISGPVLIAGLGIGLLVSILQAVTQVQEQTLTFVPKIIAMVVVLIVAAPWMGARILDFSIRMFSP